MKSFIAMCVMLLVTGVAVAQSLPITIMQGAVLCKNHGDLVVFANSGAMMPSCSRLAHQTAAIQVGTADSGVVTVHATGDSDIFQTLEASIKRR